MLARIIHIMLFSLAPQWAWARAGQSYVEAHQPEYHFYVHSLSHRSLAETASVRQISVGDLLMRIYQFRLSVERVLNRPTTFVERQELGRYLAEQGFYPLPIEPTLGVIDQLRVLVFAQVPLAQIQALAELVFGMDPLAITWMLSGKDSNNDGQLWNRVAFVMNDELTELEVIVRLYLHRVGPEQIAHYLNSVYSDFTTAPRTPEQVAAKLEELQISDSYRRDPNFYLPEYGHLKKAGKLMPWVAAHWLADHPSVNEKEMAESLNISANELETFRQTYRIPAQVWRPRMVVATPQSVFVAQREVALQVLKWMPKQGGFPNTNHFRVKPYAIEMPYATLIHVGDTARGLFSSFNDFRVASHRLGQKIGYHLRLMPIFEGPPDPLTKQTIRHEILAEVFRWICRRKKLPQVEDFGPNEGQIPMHYERLVSLGDQYRDSGFFANASEFWLEAYRYALVRGRTIDLLEVQLRHLEPGPLWNILRNQALAKVFAWYKKQGRLPIYTDFGDGPEQIPISLSRLMHSHETGLTSLFSPHEFWIHFYRLAQLAGQPFELFEVSIKGAYDHTEYRNILKREALARLATWLLKHPDRLPRREDFGPDEGRLAIPYMRLIPLGHKNQKTTLFRDREQLQREFDAYVREHQLGLTVSLAELLVRRDPPRPQPRRCNQAFALTEFPTF